jgi:hypothetical protein
VTLAAGDSKTCTITNDDISPTITLFKSVLGGSSLPTDFSMTVDGTPVPHASSISVDANTPHVISEVDPSGVGLGYFFLGISGDVECAFDPSTVILDEGVAIVCTITNSDD